LGTFQFLSHSFRHSIEFAARAFDRVLRLLVLARVHSGQGFVELLADAAQDGHRHLQIALHLFDRRRLDGQGLPLRFQK